ncbi:MAG: tetratricopeptide repeat protein [Brasilonema octagenarum HA4186-MV1]|jgi:tetratricopeptide (TPR) repeat protein|nr:tetratricopeptide repeat protein [Brasilonema octagenarum HA4186-MV1]
METTATVVTDFIDYYQILGLEPEWDTEKLRIELRKKMAGTKARVNAATGKKKQEIDQLLKKIVKATKLLTDPEAKANYDQELAEWNRTATPEQQAAAAAVPTLPELWALIDAGRYLDAVEAGKRLINYTPDDDKAWEAYAYASFRWNDFANAIYASEQAIRCNPQNAEYYADAGQYLAAAERWDQAVAQLNRAIQIAPEQVSYKLTLADIHTKYGNWGDAEAILQGVLSQDSSNQTARSFMAIVVGARAEERISEVISLADEGKKKEARKVLKEIKDDFEKAHKLAENDPDIRDLLNSESINVRRALGVNSYQRIFGLIVDSMLTLPGSLIAFISTSYTGYTAYTGAASLFGILISILILGYSWVYLAYKNNGQDLTKRLLGMQIVNDGENSVPSLRKLTFRAILKPITLMVIYLVLAAMIFFSLLGGMGEADAAGAAGWIIGIMIGLIILSFRLLFDLLFITDKDLAPTVVGAFLFLHDKLTGTTVACSTKDDFLNFGKYHWY